MLIPPLQHTDLQEILIKVTKLVDQTKGGHHATSYRIGRPNIYFINFLFSLPGASSSSVLRDQSHSGNNIGVSAAGACFYSSLLAAPFWVSTGGWGLSLPSVHPLLTRLSELAPSP